MNVEKTKMSRKPVLADHARVGKRLVPPLQHKIGPLKETSWIRVSMPELLWIACLQHVMGRRRAAELAVALSSAALKVRPEHRPWFAATSHYVELTSEQQSNVRSRLMKADHLGGIQRGLRILHGLYPHSPFGFLFNSDPSGTPSAENIVVLKSIISPLFDKTSPEATFVQATAIYLGFSARRLFVCKGQALADFPGIEEYPATEKSRIVAAAIRAAIPMCLLSLDSEYRTAWADYFWNRGLELEPCSMNIEGR